MTERKRQRKRERERQRERETWTSRETVRKEAIETHKVKET